MPHPSVGTPGLLRRLPSRAVKLAGFAIVILSLAFVGAQILAHEPWRLDPELLRRLASWSLAGAVLYGLAGFLLSTAWRLLLGRSAHGLPASAIHAVYGRTQIAKYLPGNVFHVAGRHVLGYRLGIDHAALAWASLLEAAGIVGTAGLLALPAFWLWLDPERAVIEFGFAATALGLGCLMLLPAAMAYGTRVARRFLLARRWAWAADSIPATAWWDLGRAHLLYGGFFLSVGALLWLLVASVGDGVNHVDSIPLAAPMQLAYCISTFALAWVAGYLTPGSSAGVGVREAILIVALEGAIGAPAAVGVAVALRVVTVIGDALFCLICFALFLPPLQRISPRHLSEVGPSRKVHQHENGLVG